MLFRSERAPRARLARPAARGALEVFLWVDWAKRRDQAYWLERITHVTEPNTASPGELLLHAAELKRLDPILERLAGCGVKREFITQRMTAVDGSPFLNVLWIRQLGRHYRGTLLGDLLERQAGDVDALPFSHRPSSRPVM